jgi:ubiquinone/menaquinone biosynthesis C-methylase UbiE
MGCGSGRASIGVLLARSHATVVGLDNWSADYIAGNGPELLLANARAAGVGDRISATSADMRSLPFEAASFDAIISTYAIDHLDRQGIDSSLAEAARVLRPGGDLLMMIIHQDAWLMFAYSPLVGLHAPRTAEADWRTRLERAGLEVAEVGRMPGTLYFLARRPGATAR